MDGTLVTPHWSTRTCVSVQGQSQTKRLGGSKGLDSELILALAIISGGRNGTTGSYVWENGPGSSRVEERRDCHEPKLICRQC